MKFEGFWIDFRSRKMVEKARMIDTFGHAGLTLLDKIRLTL